MPEPTDTSLSSDIAQPNGTAAVTIDQNSRKDVTEDAVLAILSATSVAFADLASVLTREDAKTLVKPRAAEATPQTDPQVPLKQETHQEDSIASSTSNANDLTPAEHARSLSIKVTDLLARNEIHDAHIELFHAVRAQQPEHFSSSLANVYSRLILELTDPVVDMALHQFEQEENAEDMTESSTAQQPIQPIANSSPIQQEKTDAPTEMANADNNNLTIPQASNLKTSASMFDIYSKWPVRHIAWILFCKIREADIKLTPVAYWQLAQRLGERNQPERALISLENLGKEFWDIHVYRFAIQMYLMKRPRDYETADALLEQFIALPPRSRPLPALFHGAPPAKSALVLEENNPSSLQRRHQHHRIHSVHFNSSQSQALGTPCYYHNDAEDKFALQLWYQSISRDSKWNACQELFEVTRSISPAAQHLPLDNAMMEVCVAHSHNEYGWAVFERMKEIDKHTPRVVATLLRQGFFESVKDLENGNAQTSGSETATEALSPDSTLASEGGNVVRQNAKSVLRRLSVAARPSSSSLTPQPQKEEKVEKAPTLAEKVAAIAESQYKWEARAWAFYHRFLSMENVRDLSGSVVYILHQLLEIMSASTEAETRFQKVNRIYNELKASPYHAHIHDDFLVTPILRLCLRCLRESIENSGHRGASIQDSEKSTKVASQQKLYFQRAFEIYEEMREIPKRMSNSRLQDLWHAKFAFGGSQGGIHEQPSPNNADATSSPALNSPSQSSSNVSQSRRCSPHIYSTMLELCLAQRDLDRFRAVCRDLLASGVSLTPLLMSELQQSHDTMMCSEKECQDDCPFKQLLTATQARIEESNVCESELSLESLNVASTPNKVPVSSNQRVSADLNHSNGTNSEGVNSPRRSSNVVPCYHPSHFLPEGSELDYEQVSRHRQRRGRRNSAMDHVLQESDARRLLAHCVQVSVATPGGF